MIRAPTLLDRDTTTTEALLQTALEQLRLEGAIFFLGAEWTDGFAFESTPNDVAGVLHPGAERVILFHIVGAGHAQGRGCGR